MHCVYTNYRPCIFLGNGKFRPVHTILMPGFWKVTDEEKMCDCVMQATDMGQTVNLLMAVLEEVFTER